MPQRQCLYFSKPDKFLALKTQLVGTGEQALDGSVFEHRGDFDPVVVDWSNQGLGDLLLPGPATGADPVQPIIFFVDNHSARNNFYFAVAVGAGLDLGAVQIDSSVHGNKISRVCFYILISQKRHYF